MKRVAQPTLSVDGRQTLDHYAYALQQVEDLSTVTIRNYLSDLRQFIAWCECSWRETEEERPFTPQAIAPPLLDAASDVEVEQKRDNPYSQILGQLSCLF